MARKNASILSTSKQELFYKEVLKYLKTHAIPFMLGGTYALKAHTGVARKTHDLDLFCKASDYPLIMKILHERGYKIEVDDRWLAKIYQGNEFVDVIFSTLNDACVVDDTWFDHAPTVRLFDMKVLVVPAEELIWSKSYRQDRVKFDGPDIYHIILKKGKTLDWKRLLMRMEAHWEILFSHVLLFRFIYPSDRSLIPQWVMEEFIKRTTNQLSLPDAKGKLCRGRLLSLDYYDIDYTTWGYTDRESYSI